MTASHQQLPIEPPHVMTVKAWKQMLAAYYRDMARQVAEQ